jgi:microcystin degradation protein MlrC
MPVDERGRLDDEPFAHHVTKDGRVLISFEGRRVSVVAGRRAARLIAALQQAAADPAAVQLLLAKATGHFKRGTER